MRLVVVGALGKFIDIIETATNSLVPFVEAILNFITQPIDAALSNVANDIPVLDFVLSLVADLLSLFFNSDNMPSILTFCLSSAISIFLLLHVIAFLNKVIGRE